MVALLILLATVTALAAVFAVVVHQMAEAHRHRYFEEVELSNLGFGLREVKRQHVPTTVKQRRTGAAPRRRVMTAAIGPGHSIPFPR